MTFYDLSAELELGLSLQNTAGLVSTKQLKRFFKNRNRTAGAARQYITLSVSSEKINALKETGESVLCSVYVGLSMTFSICLSS